MADCAEGVAAAAAQQPDSAPGPEAPQARALAEDAFAKGVCMIKKEYLRKARASTGRRLPPRVMALGGWRHTSSSTAASPALLLELACNLSITGVLARLSKPRAWHPQEQHNINGAAASTARAPRALYMGDTIRRPHPSRQRQPRTEEAKLAAPRRPQLEEGTSTQTSSPKGGSARWACPRATWAGCGIWAAF